MLIIKAFICAWEINLVCALVRSWKYDVSLCSLPISLQTITLCLMSVQRLHQRETWAFYSPVHGWNNKSKIQLFKAISAWAKDERIHAWFVLSNACGLNKDLMLALISIHAFLITPAGNISRVEYIFRFQVIRYYTVKASLGKIEAFAEVRIPYHYLNFLLIGDGGSESDVDKSCVNAPVFEDVSEIFYCAYFDKGVNFKGVL